MSGRQHRPGPGLRGPRCRRAATLALAITGAGAGCGGHDPIASTSARLINGVETTAYPAVLLLQRPSGGICGATLVGERTLLTAAHCVPDGEIPRVLADGQQLEVAEVRPSPAFRMGSLFHDIAVIHLVAAPPIRPMLVASEPPQVGQSVTLVGYGASNTSGFGVRQTGTNTVSQVTNMLVVVVGSDGGAANTCLGDSGGPSFAVIDGHEVQVGVHSTMIGDCGQQSNATRVDAMLDWIEEATDGDLARADQIEPATIQGEALIPAPAVRARSPAQDAEPAPAAPPAPPSHGASGCGLAGRPQAGPPDSALALLLLWLAAAARRGAVGQGADE